MKEKLLAAIREFELPLLVFPVLVTCIVALGFIAKCPCSIKQWWAAFALTLVIIWYRGKDKHVSVIVTAMLIMSMMLLWVLTNVFTTSGWDDTLAYHQPAIRMLASGWNPVWQNTPEGIFKSTGIASDSCAVWHIISMPKGVWYFCSCAYQFTNAHFNVLFPLIPFLYISLIYALFSAFRAYGRLFSVCICVTLFCFVSPCHDTLIDGVVTLSAIGLLVSMFDCLKCGRWDWRRLLVFSFWMSVAKQTSLLHCFLFWLIFIIVLYIDKRHVEWRKLFGGGALLFSLFLVVSVAPYITSAVNYGHPFYPKYSGNEQRHPIHNITGDFFDRNADAAEMGHVGAYINAFISTTIAKEYYIHKTGRSDFCPDNVTWGQGGASRTPGSPTSTGFRILFCLSVILLFIFGRVPGRFFSVCMLAGTLAMPTEMIGYTRYTPWALSGCALAVLLVCDRIKNGRVKHISFIVFAITSSAIVSVRFLMFCAVKIDQGFAIQMSLKNNPPKMIISSYKELKGKCARGQRAVSGNLLLLCRKVPSLAKADFVIDPIGIVEHPETCQSYFDCSFRVPSDYPITQYSILRDIVIRANRRHRMMAYPLFVVHTFCVSLPKSIWEVIYG